MLPVPSRRSCLLRTLLAHMLALGVSTDCARKHTSSPEGPLQEQGLAQTGVVTLVAMRIA